MIAIAQPGRALPMTTVFTTSTYNEIPAMTDPLGKHWRQPAGLREAEMDDTHVMLAQHQVDGLLTYDSSYPSGCYDGKCWLRNGEDVQWLCWYYPHPAPNKISIGFREIIIIN